MTVSPRTPAATATATALLTLAAILFLVADPLLAWDDANETLGHGRLFLYFTVQSVLLAAGVCVVFGVATLRGSPAGRTADWLRGLAVTDLTFAGIIGNALLGLPATYTDWVFHVIGPVALVVWWVAAPPAKPLPFTAVAWWLLHPVLWMASALVYAAESSDHWRPYFFLDPGEMGGWGGVAAIGAGVFAAYAVVGTMMVLLTRIPARRRNLPEGAQPERRP